jgi:hypothetical protein
MTAVVLNHTRAPSSNDLQARCFIDSTSLHGSRAICIINRTLHMASKEECDKYAAELTQRFEDLAKWAVENWPRRNFPLLASDFSEARREIGKIIGPKLGEGDNGPASTASNGAQYVDMNPMPWP